jgi:two-component system, NtrC family, response regulator AtoC
MTRAAARRDRRDALTILIVDDEQLHAQLLKAQIARPGRVEVEVAGSGQDALVRLAGAPFDAVLTDLMMPGMDGIELVKRIRENEPSLPVLLMTAHASIERAVEGIRAGATEFMAKPINVTALMALVERAVAERPLREEISARLEHRAAGSALIGGEHPLLDAVRTFAEQVARVAESRVLITGESGTGKSLLARMIHELSGAKGRFVAVNCAALPAHLVESELFGHEKGAFTDARALKRGLVELADRGTLFLDEIGALPLDLQTKLLLFLENREFRRVGGADLIPARTRVVTATNEDLHAKARARTFRQDLLYRLDVASIEMPSLRAMPDTIPQLAERFTRELCTELNRPQPRFTRRSFEQLAAYPWPGNVRELRNAVERALIFHVNGEFLVVPPAAPPGSAASGEPQPAATAGVTLELGLTLDEVVRRYVEATLDASDAELDTIAQRLGISRKNLWEKRKRYGLSR